MIDYLYNNKYKTVELEFDNQFKEEEQNKIKSLFKKNRRYSQNFSRK